MYKYFSVYVRNNFYNNFMYLGISMHKRPCYKEPFYKYSAKNEGMSLQRLSRSTNKRNPT